MRKRRFNNEMIEILQALIAVAGSAGWCISHFGRQPLWRVLAPMTPLIGCGMTCVLQPKSQRLKPMVILIISTIVLVVLYLFIPGPLPLLDHPL